MNTFPTAAEAEKASDEYNDERVYTLCPESEKILSDAIKRAIEKKSHRVEITLRAYAIEEGSFRVTKFLESQGYKDVSVVETGYTCFDNNRGQTSISFTFWENDCISLFKKTLWKIIK